MPQKSITAERFGMSDGRDNWENPDAFEVATKVAGACRHLMLDQLEAADDLRVETDAYGYDFHVVQPVLGITVVVSDDPHIEDRTRCVIQGSLMSPLSRMIMAGRVSVGRGLALGCVRTDDIDPEYATGPVRRVFVNGQEIVFSKDPD